MPAPPMPWDGVSAVANVCFDGNVVRHTIVVLPEGAKKTLGLIYPGR